MLKRTVPYFCLGLCLSALLTASVARALEKGDEEALNNTTAMLGDQAALQAFAKDNPDATSALAEVNKMTQGDPGKKAQVTALSNGVFAALIKKHNGDSAAAMLELQQGLKDPGQFIKNMSPEQQAQFHQLAAGLDKGGAGAKAPPSP